MIPARAGSKRIPGKNVRDFIGQPLVVWSVRAALACPALDTIVVSTDDPQVSSAVAGLGVTVVERPAHLASDTARTGDVLRDVDAGLGGAAGGPELIVLLQPTSPLREAGLVDAGLRQIRACPSASRLVEVICQRLFTGRVVGDRWVADFPDGTRSQDLPPVWYPSGRLYVLRCAAVFDAGPAAPQTCLARPGQRERCTNIDHEEDFAWARYVHDRYASDYDYLRR